MMHQAIAETLTYKARTKGASQVVKLIAESPIPISELEQATFEYSKKRDLADVRGVNPLENISKNAVYIKRAPKKDTVKEYGLKESMAINARNEPIMTPLQPRLLYTPLDTSFLNATLPSDDKLVQTVSQTPFSSPHQNHQTNTSTRSSGVSLT